MKFGKVFRDVVIDGLKHINLSGLSEKDTLTKVQVAPTGVDSTPHDKYVALYCETSTRGSGAVVGYIQEKFIAKAGEIRIFSEDVDGQLKAYVYCDENGNVNINGDSDNLVRYSKLNTSLQQFLTDIKTELTAISSGISTAGGAYTPNPLLKIDISQSKINNVKTN